MERPFYIGELYFDHCRECGEDMFIDEDGVSHHEEGGGGINYDLDGQHVAVAQTEPAQ